MLYVQLGSLVCCFAFLSSKSTPTHKMHTEKSRKLQNGHKDSPSSSWKRLCRSSSCSSGVMAFLAMTPDLPSASCFRSHRSQRTRQAKAANLPARARPTGGGRRPSRRPPPQSHTTCQPRLSRKQAGHECTSLACREDKVLRDARQQQARACHDQDDKQPSPIERSVSCLRHSKRQCHSVSVAEQPACAIRFA